ERVAAGQIALARRDRDGRSQRLAEDVEVLLLVGVGVPVPEGLRCRQVALRVGHVGDRVVRVVIYPGGELVPGRSGDLAGDGRQILAGLATYRVIGERDRLPAGIGRLGQVAYPVVLDPGGRAGVGIRSRDDLPKQVEGVAPGWAAGFLGDSR